MKIQKTYYTNRKLFKFSLFILLQTIQNEKNPILVPQNSTDHAKSQVFHHQSLQNITQDPKTTHFSKAKQKVNEQFSILPFPSQSIPIRSFPVSPSSPFRKSKRVYTTIPKVKLLLMDTFKKKRFYSGAEVQVSKRFHLFIIINSKNYMRKSTILSVALILGLFLVLQAAANVISAYSETANPICNSPGILALDTMDLSGPGQTIINFDYATNYYDTDGDSAPLLVRKGDGSSAGWKFLTYVDNSLDLVQSSECTGTATGVFVSLVGKALIVKVGTAYQLCQFNAATPSAVINPKVLSAPATGITTISKLSAYFCTSSKVYVTITDNTNTAVYSYDTTAASPIPAVISGSIYTGKVLSTAYGTEGVIYSSAVNGFVPVGTWTPIDPTNTIAAGNTVAQYRMRGGTVVVTDLNPAKTSGGIYSITASTVTKLSYSDSTTVAFMDFGDDLSNFIRVGTTSVFWYNQQTTATAFYTATIPVSEINAGATGSIESVGLSGDKATILYSNKIIYLKITGNNMVKEIYETAPAGFMTASEYQYKMVVSCFCQLIKRFMCFSSNLNCLIVKKGSDTCSKSDPFIV